MEKKNNIVITDSFFESIGNLYFAIASCDRLVHEKEMKTVQHIIEDEWGRISKLNSKYQRLQYQQITQTFMKLNIEKTYTSNDCFNAFIQYKSNHESQFTLPIKKCILNSANAIAQSYAKKNKSELMMLAKLQLNFNKLSS